MGNISTNPDLPRSWRRPGTYFYYNLNNPGSAPGKRLLLLGERISTGLRPANALYKANSEQDVIDGAGSTSVLRMLYQAAIAQVGGGTCEIYIGQVDEASGGTAAIIEHMITGPATGAGQFNWSLCGRVASIGFASGDSATTIASALATQAAVAFAGLPIASIVAASGKITVTVKSKAAWGEDLPSVFEVTPGRGVKVGPGDYVLATNATGAGSIRVTCGRTNYTASIANGDTPTIIAAAAAAAVVGDGPLSASAASGTLSLFYNNGWPIRRVTATILTSTGTTINVNARGAVSAGTDAPNGVIGLGSATLTTLLAAIDAQSRAFRAWAPTWNDATTLGTLDAAIEDEGGGLKQRTQTLNFASNATLATAGAIPAATTPALTASIRCAEGWAAYECGNAAFELAARFAAARVVNDRPSKNFNGLRLKYSAAAPLVGPPPSGRSSGADINSAINDYGMAPIVWDDDLGAPVVEHSRTTSNSADRALHKWSLVHQLDAQRELIGLRFKQRFTLPDGTGVSLMTSGTPFSEGVVELEDFEDCLFACTVEAERAGYYDGADALKEGIKATQDSGDPGRINLVYTASALVDVDQISGVGNRGTAPAAV